MRLAAFVKSFSLSQTMFTSKLDVANRWKCTRLRMYDHDSLAFWDTDLVVFLDVVGVVLGFSP